ncbi:MAG: ketopantoate reductase family protein [Tannerella sp.]|jgi:2-dehydropantoate 2-reductase|nr:ketopantoate reductase family protein [Tannerella sp.]
MKNIKYLIVGTGGVGGNMAGFLAHNGCDVTCIARGKHLEAIRNNGLRLKSSLKGDFIAPVKAYTSEEYADKADVIFVCVKGYSLDSITGLLQKASHNETIIIPLLNIFGTGKTLKQLLPDLHVLAGCIYIVGYVSAPGEITQMRSAFRVVFGAMKGTTIDADLLQQVRNDLTDSGIKVDISDNIEQDTFLKFSLISAMACTGAYFDVPMRAVQMPGEEREVFTSLSSESYKIGKAMGIPLPDNLAEHNLKMIDALDPDSTASMQKDIANGHESEIDGLLFEFIRLAEKYHIDVPVYRKVAEKFGK